MVRSYLKKVDRKIHMLEYYIVICVLYLCLVLKKNREYQGIFPPNSTKDPVCLFLQSLWEFHELFIQMNLK